MCVCERESVCVRERERVCVRERTQMFLGFRVEAVGAIGALAVLRVANSGLLWCGPTKREDALSWDRPRVVYHGVYISIRRFEQGFFQGSGFRQFEQSEV